MDMNTLGYFIFMEEQEKKQAEQTPENQDDEAENCELP